jgi:uncharacterized damage-inducible protein DinB
LHGLSLAAARKRPNAQHLSFRFTDGDAGAMTREEMLFHVITDGVYHRGNVGQVLKENWVAPPRDLYAKFLHLHEPSRRHRWV